MLARLACNGISKARDTDDAMTVYFNRPLTEEEITFFNNCILRWARFAPVRYSGGETSSWVEKVNIVVPPAHQ